MRLDYGNLVEKKKGRGRCGGGGVREGGGGEIREKKEEIVVASLRLVHRKK